MTQGDAAEAFAILKAMLAGLLNTLTGRSGGPGAALRYACGDLEATGLASIVSGALAAPLLQCFLIATASGATVDGMEAVRTAMLTQQPSGNPGKAVAGAGIRFALSSEAVILAGTTFTSSDDVFAAMAAANAGFEQAEEFCADNRDPGGFQSLIALHASVVRDLTTRAVALPKLVAYAVPAVLTSHALANRLYGDASRCDELWAENPTPHPAFMPLRGKCLSD